MPPFLPVTAINRSQRIRIAGQTVLPGKVTYVDFGNLAVPGSFNEVANKEISATQTATGAKAPGLKKGKYFGYAVSALDAYGGETPVSGTTAFKSEAGAEGAGEYNEIKLTWTPVPFATGYKVYRSGVAKTGLASEAAALAAAVEYIAETTKPEYADYGQVDKAKGEAPTTNNTFYNTNKVAAKPWRELQNHLAIGAVLTVGPLTLNPGDWAPFTVKTWELKLESEKIKLEKGEIKQRSTGIVRAVAEGKPTIAKAAATEEYLYLIVYNWLTNEIEAIKGTKAKEGKATWANVQEKVTSYQQILFGLKQTGEGTTPELVAQVLSGGIISSVLSITR